MNVELRKMIVDAEGRYLTEAEIARVREYAMNMNSRLDAANRLSASERGIVDAAVLEFAKKNAEYVASVPEAREKTARDMMLTLRYVAAAHVRQDLDFFVRNYASWIGDLLRALVSPEVLVGGYECLRQAVDDALDPVDARAFNRYLDVFIEALRK